MILQLSNFRNIFYDWAKGGIYQVGLRAAAVAVVFLLLLLLNRKGLVVEDTLLRDGNHMWARHGRGPHVLEYR